MGNLTRRLLQYSNERRKIQYNSMSNLNYVEYTNLFYLETNASSCDYSEFYKACRDNKINEVQRLLENMSLEDIDRVEPCGTTALHVASFCGHADIVKLLLEKGADRAIPNRFQYLPFDEAANDDIKELFYRVPNGTRLISNTEAIEWVQIHDYVIENATVERNIIKSIYNNGSGPIPIETMFERIESYIENGLRNVNQIKNIRRFFRKATQEKDPRWIIKAYTAETDFYKFLNRELAGGATNYQRERRYIVALLRYHPVLEKLAFIGSAYRTMKVKQDDLNQYTVGCSFMLKSLVSTSIDRKLAELFLCRYEINRQANEVSVRPAHDPKTGQALVLCIYEVKHHRSALHIENFSQYPNEGEVVLMPYTVFTVKCVQEIQIPHLDEEHLITEIFLEESDQYLNE